MKKKPTVTGASSEEVYGILSRARMGLRIGGRDFRYDLVQRMRGGERLVLTEKDHLEMTRLLSRFRYAAEVLAPGFDFHYCSDSEDRTKALMWMTPMELKPKPEDNADV